MSSRRCDLSFRKLVRSGLGDGEPSTPLLAQRYKCVTFATGTPRPPRPQGSPRASSFWGVRPGVAKCGNRDRDDEDQLAAYRGASSATACAASCCVQPSPTSSGNSFHQAFRRPASPNSGSNAVSAGGPFKRVDKGTYTLADDTTSPTKASRAQKREAKPGQEKRQTAKPAA